MPLGQLGAAQFVRYITVGLPRQGPISNKHGVPVPLGQFVHSRDAQQCKMLARLAILRRSGVANVPEPATAPGMREDTLQIRKTYKNVAQVVTFGVSRNMGVSCGPFWGQGWPLAACPSSMASNGYQHFRGVVQDLVDKLTRSIAGASMLRLVLRVTTSRVQFARAGPRMLREAGEVTT